MNQAELMTLSDGTKKQSPFPTRLHFLKTRLPSKVATCAPRGSPRRALSIRVKKAGRNRRNQRAGLTGPPAVRGPAHTLAPDQVRFLGRLKHTSDYLEPFSLRGRACIRAANFLLALLDGRLQACVVFPYSLPV